MVNEEGYVDEVDRAIAERWERRPRPAYGRSPVKVLIDTIKEESP